MAELIAKGLVGDTMDQVTGAFGNDKKSKDDGEDEFAEARKLEEDKRKDKHKKMEEEREKVRQQIRDKYNLKKKDPATEAANKYGRKGTGADQTNTSTDDQSDETQNETSHDAQSSSSTGAAQSSTDGGKCLLQ